MSFQLPHLHSGWAVDQAILAEPERLVCIRFGHDWDPECMKMDECIKKVVHEVSEMAIFYLVDISEVPDFNKMYELYDPCTVMFFFRFVLVFCVVHSFFLPQEQAYDDRSGHW